MFTVGWLLSPKHHHPFKTNLEEMWAGEMEFSLLVPVSLSHFKTAGLGFRASGASQPFGPLKT